MRIEFRFNGTQQIILTPDDKKDEQLIQLFCGGHKCVKFGQPPAASATSVVFESYSIIDESQSKLKLTTYPALAASDK